MTDPNVDLPDEDRPDDTEGTYGLVMPFVTVASKGGPHDDQAYVCGWEAGALDADLRMAATVGATQLDRTVHAANLPQLDLVAMKHGFRMVHHEWEPELAGTKEWAAVSFTRADEFGGAGE